MKILLAAAFLILGPSLAWADEASACAAAAGSYLSGVVVGAPIFQHGQFRKGVELSHTHIKVKADQDGRVYDVAIDNVFVSGYDAQPHGIPAPVNAIAVNDRVDLCGQLYTTGVGIHWVHTNCGHAPTGSQPDGWLKKFGADGSPGPNMDGSTEYCAIFSGHRNGRRQPAAPRY